MLSLAAIAFVGLRPGMGQMESWVQWNFVPFVDLARSLDQPSWVQQIAITNLVGNVLFFVPWGIMVALRFPGARWLALLATTAAVSLGVETSHVIAISGRIEDDRFLPEHLVRLDGGPDFYAPAAVIAPDGRHLLLGWIPEDPPDEASSTRDWAGALTLPRVISLRPEGGLTQVPAEELARLRSSRRHSLETAPRTPLQVPVSDHFELLASFTSVGECGLITF